jgi:hypothetical protein
VHAEHAEHLDVRVRMHLQGLILALRSASGSAEAKQIRLLWTDALVALGSGASLLSRHFLAAQSHAAGGAEGTQHYMYLPGDASGAAVSSPSVLLAEMAKCDKITPSPDDRSLLSSLPEPDPCQQWTCAAATYAEALRLMVHTSKKFLATESKPQEQGKLPGCAAGTGSPAMACIPTVYVCCWLSGSLW